MRPAILVACVVSLISISCAASVRPRGVPPPTQAEEVTWRYIQHRLDKIALYHNQKAVPACIDFDKALSAYIDKRKELAQVVNLRVKESRFELTVLWEEMMDAYSRFEKAIGVSTNEIRQLRKDLEKLPH